MRKIINGQDSVEIRERRGEKKGAALKYWEKEQEE